MFSSEWEDVESVGEMLPSELESCCDIPNECEVSVLQDMTLRQYKAKS